MKWLQIAGFLALFTSCKSLEKIKTLEEGTYRVHNITYLKGPETAKQLSKNEKVYVEDDGEELRLTFLSQNKKEVKIRLDSSGPLRLQLIQRKLDVDGFTIPIKIRPAQQQIPTQLNSDFNAAGYIGKRTNLFTLRNRRLNNKKRVRELKTVGISYGAFAGFGAVKIEEEYTNPEIDYKYEAVVFHGGIAAIFDARAFNIGLALGIDHLTDKNRKRWIYQNKPWIGVLFGLDLN